MKAYLNNSPKYFNLEWNEHGGRRGKCVFIDEVHGCLRVEDNNRNIALSRGLFLSQLHVYVVGGYSLIQISMFNSKDWNRYLTIMRAAHNVIGKFNYDREFVKGFYDIR